MGVELPILDRKTLASLVSASSAIVGELSLREVFLRIAEQAATVLAAEAASVLLLDPADEVFVFESAVGPHAMPLIGHRFDAALGIAGQAAKARRAIRVDDVRQNRNFFPGIDAITSQQTRSMIAAPLIHADRVLGVVEVLNPVEREAFNDRDVELMQVFANLAAAAAGNTQAYEKSRPAHRSGQDDAQQMIGRSAAVQRIIELCRKVALSSATVLLYGETGTGKELAANAIHTFSNRRDKPFVAVNCAALPENLLESELFGHEKGAFTGASQQKPGRFEVADGGTIFLDEVGEMAASIQAKLLRALQERSFVRVGGTHTIECDVRVIAATNRDLKHEMEGGRFRPDLYYRLNVFPITLPPLRQRAEDLPMLIDHLTNDLSGSVRPIQEDALAALLRYSWPGNIRELRNVIERALLLAGDGAISLRDLPEEVLSTGGGGEPQAPTASSPAAGSESRLVEHEKTLILHALNKTDWNQSAAARELGITRDLLRYRMKKYALKRPQ